MARIRISDFHGIAPKYDRRQLPPGRAQVAQDVRFDADDLRPLRESVREQLLSGVDAGRLFFYVLGNTTRTLAWGHQLDIDYVEGPIVNDEFNRAYWTDGVAMRGIENPPNPPTDGYDLAVGSPSTRQPFLGYLVGVEPPESKPSVVNITTEKEVGFGTGVVIQGFSASNPVTVSTDVAHPFENGDRVVIAVDDSLDKPTPAGEGSGGATTGPPPSEIEGEKTIAPADLQIWDFDGREYIVQNVSPSGNQFELFGADASGYGNFPKDDLLLTTIRQVVDENDLNSMSYVYTYVTVHGEEGPPSPASDFIDRLDDGSAEITIAESAYVGRGDPDRINRIRVYRTVTGTSGTNFQLLGTLPFGPGVSEDSDQLTWSDPPNQTSPASAWNAKVIDAVPPVEIGEILPSEGWFPPPLGLAGLTLMPNGYFVGFKDRTLYFSEPFLPHAWDPDNAKVTDEEIIGIAVTGNILVIGTRGRPEFGSGADPLSFSKNRAKLHAPLLHKNALINAGNGAAYPSTDGLVLVGAGGARYLTQTTYDKKTWIAAAENRDQAVFHDQRYILFGRNQNPLMMDLTDRRDGIEVSELTEKQFGAAAKRDDDLLFMAFDTAEYRDLRIFNDDSAARAVGIWRSGLYTMPRPVSFAWCQVFADGYPLTLRILYPDPALFDAGTRQYDLSDANLKEITLTVSGAEPFRVPSDFTSREYVVVVETAYRVQQLFLAETQEELQQL